MAKDSPLNIFNASAKSKKPVVTSSGSGAPTTTGPRASTPVPTRSLTIDGMLERMNEMRKDIDDKLNALMNTNGISPELLQQFLGNQENFTPEQWDFLQKKNQEFSNKIWSTVEPVNKIVRLEVKNKVEVEAKTSYDKSTGPATTGTLPGRKSKFSGSRRKWIPTG